MLSQKVLGRINTDIINWKDFTKEDWQYYIEDLKYDKSLFLKGKFPDYEYAEEIQFAIDEITNLFLK